MSSDSRAQITPQQASQRGDDSCDLSPLSDLTSFRSESSWYEEYAYSVRFFIGPTNHKGRHPSINRSLMTEVIFHRVRFDEFEGCISRFFGDSLKVMIVGKSRRVTDQLAIIPEMQGHHFLHRAAGGFHILCRIYEEDVCGKAARKRLHTVAQELEDISSSEGSSSSQASGSV